jgi:hypothetical protein
MQSDVLHELERAVLRGRPRDVARRLLSILEQMDRAYGKLPIRADEAGPEALRALERDCARLAQVLAIFVTHPETTLEEALYRALLNVRRNIESLFCATSFEGSDHAVAALLERDALGNETASGDRLAKALLLYSRNSARAIDPEAIWRTNPLLAVNAFLAILSSRIAVSPPEYAWQEKLLAWLPDKLRQTDFTQIAVSLKPDLWMQCSYASTPTKHAIKRELNEIVRKGLLANGVLELRGGGKRPPGPGARIVCILEWFTSNHAMYRAYSPSVRALRERFEVIAVVPDPAFADAPALALFDRVIRMLSDSPHIGAQIAELSNAIRQADPDIIWYPSIGMAHASIALSTLRLAPLQVMSIGHPATSMSPAIDAVIVDADFVNDPACFNEEVIRLPPRSMPFAPPGNEIPLPDRTRGSGALRAAVQCSVMKLNPVFLDAVRQVSSRSSRRIELHFLVTTMYGACALHVMRAIRTVLPDAVVRWGLGYAEYMAELANCDIVLAPFPFGNTNGWIDAARLALPGVCMDGPEPHTHIDQALLARLGLPRSLVADSVEDYVGKALKLIEEDDFRQQLSAHLREVDVSQVLFEGNAALFADAMLDLVNTRVWTG